MVLKVVYFDIAGRAEATRLTLVAGGQDFEDVRLSRDDWMSTWKAKSPTGQAPLMVLDDGRIIAQSMALQVYAAQKSGLYPSDQVDQARTMELMACLEDVRALTHLGMRLYPARLRVASVLLCPRM